MIFVCAVLSGLCKLGLCITCAGLLGCGGVEVFTFFIRPSLPCPILGLF